jgi:hypothetical protein
MMAGQNGGQSISLDRSSLFVFSDTLIALAPRQAVSSLAIPLRREQAQFLGNCAAISHATELPGAMSSLRYFTDAQDRPREILAPTLAERLAGYRFWPQHGIAVGSRSPAVSSKRADRCPSSVHAPWFGTTCGDLVAPCSNAMSPQPSFSDVFMPTSHAL